MTIEVQHGNAQATHAIIWLHGLGASSNDFPPVVPHLGLKPTPSIRFIFPQAPSRPITINNGYVMPGWYDIKGISIEEKHDREGIEESRATIDALIEEQMDLGVKSENIILAGFSQGGAIAYYTALRSKHKLGGILALSTYLLYAEQTESERDPANNNIPIFTTHGTLDTVVPLQLGRQSAEKLEALGYPVRWKTYPMEHEINLEQIKAIGNWINDRYESQ